MEMTTEQMANDAMEKTSAAVDKGADKVRETMDKTSAAVEMGSEKVRETMEKATKGFEKLSSFQKDSLEALMESASVAGKSFEKIQAEIAAYTKTATEGLSEASKSILGAKSVQAAIEAQSTYAKTSFEGYFGEMKKLNEMMMAATKDAMAPIQGRAKAFVELFGHTV